MHSVGANAKHGLRRSNKDKRKAVTTLLLDEQWCQWSDRAIAKQCQVSNRFVSNIRKELSVNGSQMERNHTRKVKRGNQIYEQRQPQTSASQQPVLRQTETAEKTAQPKRQSVIPKVRSDINETICKFLGVEQPSGKDWGETVYLIPEDLNLELERLFYKIEGGKVNHAIAVTDNQAGAQQEVKNWANAVCLVADSQCFCARLIWYFGPERDQFLSLFREYGVAFVLSEEDH